MTLSGVASKIDGVIHGSRTNQPPKLTPRIFSPPKSNFSALSRLTCDIRPAGLAWPTVHSSTAAAAALEMDEKIMVGMGLLPV